MVPRQLHSDDAGDHVAILRRDVPMSYVSLARAFTIIAAERKAAQKVAPVYTYVFAHESETPSVEGVPYPNTLEERSTVFIDTEFKVLKDLWRKEPLFWEEVV